MLFYIQSSLFLTGEYRRLFSHSIKFHSIIEETVQHLTKTWKLIFFKTNLKPLIMRPLTDDEQRQVLKKLDFFIGTNVAKLIDRSDGTYCFRLHKERVFYAHQKLMQAACTVPGDALGSFGVCIGKFTKSRKFRLHVTAVDYAIFSEIFFKPVFAENRVELLLFRTIWPGSEFENYLNFLKNRVSDCPLL